MITKINAYKSSDGTAHSTLEEAQKHELFVLVSKWTTARSASTLKENTLVVPVDEIANSIVESGDLVIDVLTTKSNSLTKARKINGGTKKRTPKHIAEQHPLPLGETRATA